MVPTWVLSGLVTLIVVLLSWELVVRQRLFLARHARRAQQMTQAQADFETPLQEGSLAWKLRQAGFAAGPNAEATFGLLRIAAGAAAALLATALGFPPLVALAFGAVAWLMPMRVVEGRLQARAHAIDRDLPLFYVRLASVMQTEPHAQAALQAVVDSLEAQGDSPLLQEMRRVARSADFAGALRDLEKRSPTPSLAHLAFALRRYAERGASSTFGGAMNQAAGRLVRILSARAKARAKASDSKISVYSILGVLLLVYTFFLQDPAIKHGISSPFVQVVLLVLVGWMVVGLQVIQGMIDSVG
jgi:Flp pilus assembly protein TadB